MHPWIGVSVRISALIVWCFVFLYKEIITNLNGTQQPEKVVSSVNCKALSRSRGDVSLELKQQLIDPLYVDDESEPFDDDLNPTVLVNMFVESLCIDSKVYFDEQLMPAYRILGPAVMNLHVTVFGNAHIGDSGESLECQHGPGAS